MNLESVSPQLLKRYFGLSRKELSSIKKIKRQGALSNEFFNRFIPKRYPSIFLDERLGTKLLK